MTCGRYSVVGRHHIQGVHTKPLTKMLEGGLRLDKHHAGQHMPTFYMHNYFCSCISHKKSFMLQFSFEISSVWLIIIS